MSIVSCPNCGHPNADSAKFCAKCGNKLTPAETLVMGMGDPSQSMPSSPPVAPREATPPLSAKEQAGYGAPPVGYATLLRSASSRSSSSTACSLRGGSRWR